VLQQLFANHLLIDQALTAQHRDELRGDVLGSRSSGADSRGEQHARRTVIAQLGSHASKRLAKDAPCAIPANGDSDAPACDDGERVGFGRCNEESHELAANANSRCAQ
jgi:hypothetical protein